MTIVGYSDTLSVRPGDALDFKVSCDSAATFDAAIVRLIHGDTLSGGPGYKEQAIPSDLAPSWPARHQPVHPGSYVVVDDHPALRTAVPGLAAYVCPTTPHKGPQAVIAKWHAPSRGGYALVIDERGCAALWVGDGSGGFASLGFSRPLTTGNWYYLAASLDAAGGARVEQRPLPGGPASRELVPEPAAAGDCVEHGQIGLAPGGDVGVPVTIAAWTVGLDGERPRAGGHFNGKIDRAGVAARQLAAADLDASRRRRAPRGRRRALGLAAGLRRDGIRRTGRRDRRGPNGLHGRGVNRPTRAVTGFNWTGDEHDWRLRAGAVRRHPLPRRRPRRTRAGTSTSPARVPADIAQRHLRRAPARRATTEDHVAVLRARPARPDGADRASSRRRPPTWPTPTTT